ncbi:MAG: DeoR/GlpR family DNA-binding transcription regulator [Verrucomicrobiota bacterium]
MLAPQRYEEILKQLEERGTVRTMALAKELQVTDETIRKDLQFLSETSQIVRFHGGASLRNGRPRLRSFHERRRIEAEKKHAIANLAINLIQPGHTYAFDSSTTVHSVVSILPNVPIRVITNAFGVMETLADLDSIELVSTGGQYHKKTQTFIGNNSLELMHRHKIDVAFISCVGLDFQRGASEAFEAQSLFKECLVQIAEQVILLLDSTKLNKRSEYFFARTENISCIITDSGLSEAARKSLAEYGIAYKIAELGNKQ